MFEWPLERRTRRSRPAQHWPFAYAIPDSARSDDNSRSEFRAIVTEILKSVRKQSDAKSTLVSLESLALAASSSENEALSTAARDLTLVLACVEALRQEPTADTWEYLWSLAWHSASLEHDLPRAVVAAAAADAQFKSQFLDVAAKVVEHTVRNPQRRGAPRERGLARQLREDWEKTPQLSQLWWGLDRHTRGLLLDDDGVLRIVADLDLNALMNLLIGLGSPFSVDAGLFAVGARWSFARWQALVRIAPVTFEADGTWTDSPILPLLLFLGRDQLQDPQTRLGRNAPEEDVKGAAQEIADLVQEIARTIATRSDAVPCAQRWTNWLMRQMLAGLSNEANPFPADARSRGYADAVLVEALVKEIPLDTRDCPSPKDAEPWELWCSRCVFVQAAIVNKIPMPPVEPFLAEWHLTPDDWTSQRGRSLRAHAHLFEVFSKRADAYGLRLLALPLVEVADPCEIWRRLWDGTQTLREIVEFGDADASPDEEWRGRSESSGLARLAFGLGLMMMDHIILPTRQIQYDRRATLIGLLGVLTEAVREMSAIDHWDQGYWSGAMRHLSIRRATWLVGILPEASPAATAAFEESTKPTLADFVGELAGDTENLLAFVEVALRNRVGRERLKQALTVNGIDIQRETNFAERLLKLAPKRAGVGPEQLSAARSLLS